MGPQLGRDLLEGYFDPSVSWVLLLGLLHLKIINGIE